VLLFVTSEGLPVATAAMGLVCACVLTVVSAGVLWSNARGRERRLETLPLLLVAVGGAILVILSATDGVHRDNFGSANAEDGAFAAAVTASLWLLGGLSIARVRRVGALLIMLATFIVWYSFVTLHLVKGATSLSQVAAKSGVIWAIFSASGAILAAASFLVALAMFAAAVVRRRRAKSALLAPAARPARR
jgi:glucan phosphoethanolaminetransferase (alkaline phosphatase superfamily)